METFVEIIRWTSFGYARQKIINLVVVCFTGLGSMKFPYVYPDPENIQDLNLIIFLQDVVVSIIHLTSTIYSS